MIEQDEYVYKGFGTGTPSVSMPVIITAVICILIIFAVLLGE